MLIIDVMGRISERTKMERRQLILDVVNRNDGIPESEIESLTGLQRRTVNNYLRELAQRGMVERRGWNWYAVDGLAVVNIAVYLPREEIGRLLGVLRGLGIEVDSV